MAKALELIFRNEMGKLATISVIGPKEPVDPATVKAAMENLIAKDVFGSSGGSLVSIEGARIVERNVTDYELM
ncbi:DUF2922 domain-containing protein [Rossellomorea marisflavi]|jgi:Protein of unknown function (DUF2922)|uniref:DUF2922 domain-containing protein n=1 Tax=Rossellomorea marisflavi TaxID=189381 RepID=UPI002853191D|nr:DUF2922 domain-containing protein [Rossellomorea marisflavi]MDR4938981.1 DUF2922 domain-containing protein [Rossellomorea marisflavi]